MLVNLIHHTKYGIMTLNLTVNIQKCQPSNRNDGDNSEEPPELNKVHLKFQSAKVNTNKRPMGHIAHLRKQFKSINTYDYIITLIKRRKNNIIYFMRIFCFFI